MNTSTTSTTNAKNGFLSRVRWRRSASSAVGPVAVAERCQHAQIARAVEYPLAKARVLHEQHACRLDRDADRARHDDAFPRAALHEFQHHPPHADDEHRGERELYPGVEEGEGEHARCGGGFQIGVFVEEDERRFQAERDEERHDADIGGAVRHEVGKPDLVHARQLLTLYGCRQVHSFQKSRVRSWRVAWSVFFRMLCTCAFTVPNASCSSLAMFWLSLPMSTRAAISRSRAVSL